MNTRRLEGVDLDLKLLTENINNRLRYFDIPAIYKTRCCRGWLEERNTSKFICDFIQDCAKSSITPGSLNRNPIVKIEGFSIRRRYSYSRLDVEIENRLSRYEMTLRVLVTNPDTNGSHSQGYRLPLYANKPQIDFAQ